MSGGVWGPGSRCGSAAMSLFPKLEGTLASAPLALAQWAAAQVAKEARISPAARCHPALLTASTASCGTRAQQQPQRDGHGQRTSPPSSHHPHWQKPLAVVTGAPDGSASNRAACPEGLCWGQHGVSCNENSNLHFVFPGRVGCFLPCYFSTNPSSRADLWHPSASAKSSIKADNTICSNLPGSSMAPEGRTRTAIPVTEPSFSAV